MGSHMRAKTLNFVPKPRKPTAAFKKVGVCRVLGYTFGAAFFHPYLSAWLSPVLKVKP